MTTSIQATESDTSKFLELLGAISAEQKNICKVLDELIMLTQMPSESVLKVLEGIVTPMGRQLDDLSVCVRVQLAGK